MTAGVRVVSAEPAGVTPPGEGRIARGDGAVVVLDGASGTDGRSTVQEYVAHLSSSIIDVLDTDVGLPLREALHRALRDTVERLGVVPGRSPSSTVSIVRRRGGVVDCLSLCDSPIGLGPTGDRMIDDRLAILDLPTRRKIHERLASGCGYDETHRELLAELTAERASFMNRPGGYWVAEATPDAAWHAHCRTVRVDRTPWIVMLTDGADATMRHVGVDPVDLVDRDQDELEELLAVLHRWESDHDPEALALPRYKRHDDKTIALVGFP